ncbi:hypothetical protein [Paraburkholderia sediminicola]|uniref:hypothetical protein n=1 Tax=Paraburkholderia sediminicola TaxID=458836 RepID=UPI0038BCF8A2
MSDHTDAATRDSGTGAFLTGHAHEAGIQVEDDTVDILAATARAPAQQKFTEPLHGPH